VASACARGSDGDRHQWHLGVVVVAAPAASGTAPGGPGATSYLDVARKDCFGSARNETSKVWFTVAGGVLSDVFSPNIEA
jgi:glucoamylase